MALAGIIADSEHPIVFQAFSSYDQNLRRFAGSAEIIADIKSEMAAGRKHLHYAVYFSDSKGTVSERKFALDPAKCGGHTWRCAVEGWGLIHLQADLRKTPRIECAILVNSEKRANAWAPTYSEIGAPALWDWKMVNKHANRIVRQMKAIAKRSRPSC